MSGWKQGLHGTVTNLSIAGRPGDGGVKETQDEKQLRVGG